ncbi:smoothelin-like protein 1 isoform X1 [Rhinatrema bivittatum]|uniref:smoothelin-like protein 1 isoform X1 n=1 Tax=Rhinatrema bivittatum TaxID=194408 RepID=UPI001126267B|nr:smoothelin-like protein 1 isoform X1 [Rhinatrema bivittatum]
MDGETEETAAGEAVSQSPMQEAEVPGNTEEPSLERTQSDTAQKEEEVSGTEALEEAKTVEEAEAETKGTEAKEIERSEEIEKEKMEGEDPAATEATEEKEEEMGAVQAGLPGAAVQEAQEEEEVTEDKGDTPDTTEEEDTTSGGYSAAEKETEDGLERIPQDDKPLESSQSTHEMAPSSAAEIGESTTETGATPSDTDAQDKPASLASPPSETGTKEDSGPNAESKPKKSLERKREIPRSRPVPKSYGAQSRKAIMEKFGGPVSGASPGIKMQRSTSGASGVKSMLLEWCRAKTRGYEAESRLLTFGGGGGYDGDGTPSRPYVRLYLCPSSVQPLTEGGKQMGKVRGCLLCDSPSSPVTPARYRGCDGKEESTRTRLISGPSANSSSKPATLLILTLHFLEKPPPAMRCSTDCSDTVYLTPRDFIFIFPGNFNVITKKKKISIKMTFPLVFLLVLQQRFFY